jgi:ATP-binding cassette, subfamily B, bacterial PglK
MILKNLLLLQKKEKKFFFILIIVIVINSLLEVLGLFSVLPFIALVSDPNIVQNNQIISKIYLYTNNLLNLNNINSFIVLMGFASIFGIFLSLLLRLTNVVLITKFVFKKEHETSSYLLSYYLSRTYEWFCNQNISQINKNILSEVNIVITGSLVQLLNLISHLILTFFVFFFLILFNPKPSLIIGFSIGLSYLAIYKVLKKKLFSLGLSRTQANAHKFGIVNKAFSNFKMVKLYELENHFSDQFKKNSKLLSRANILTEIYGFFPRYFIEVIIFTATILIVLFFFHHGNNFISLIPNLGLFVLAAYKIIPSIQQIFFSVSKLKFYENAVESLLKELNLFSIIKTNNNYQKIENLDFNKNIKLENIHFTYQKGRKILKNINMIIPRFSKIGIAGKTGSGKSTLIDIIIGLLNPSSGRILIDDKILSINNILSWKKKIGYVPQQIYLSDNSLKHNIAFGLNEKDIDFKKIKHAAELSCIDEFIEALPHKYDTIVGERGIRLSGGEIQRIGIARALYRDPKIIIFDEATSALDNLTESLINDAVQNQIAKSITLINISHRLQSLKNCDKIYILEGGEFIREGSYNDLFKN